jgi:hypothetical protein
MPSNRITPAEWEALHGDGAIPESERASLKERREALPPSSTFNVRIVSDEERELWKAAYCSALTGAALPKHPAYVGSTENAAVFADLAVEDFRKKFRQP